LIDFEAILLRIRLSIENIWLKLAPGYDLKMETASKIYPFRFMPNMDIKKSTRIQLNPGTVG
jgi:hypothetical protein